MIFIDNVTLSKYIQISFLISVDADDEAEVCRNTVNSYEKNSLISP